MQALNVDVMEESDLPLPDSDIVPPVGCGVHPNQEQRAERLLERILHITAPPSDEAPTGLVTDTKS